MRQRGRPSTASMMAVMPGDRPAPPDELQPDEAIEWRKIVDRLPPEWFPVETHPLLIQLCRHICTARHVAAQLRKLEADPALLVPKVFETYRKFVRMQDQSSGLICLLSVKLRLSKSSQITSAVAHTGATKTVGRPKPWIMGNKLDDDDDDHASH